MEKNRVNLLKDHIKASGLTAKAFAEAVGMAESTFYRKIDNPEGISFTVLEAQKTAKVLRLTNDEAVSIFF